jgi:membrane protease YdiL (CAAX protease family)
MRSFVRRHSLVVYVALAYAISWAHWIPLAVSGALVTPGGSITHFPGLLGPALAAFVVVAVTDGTAGVRRLLRSMLLPTKPRGRLLAYSLSPVAFLALALVVALITGMALPPASAFAAYSGLPPLSLPLVLLLVLIFNGYGEETGWRGFALARLQQRFGPLKGALVLALIWAGWHTPTFFCIEGYRSLGVAGLIGGFGLGICAGSLVLARIANRTGGSVLAAAVWHAAYNMTSATAASRGVIGAVTTTCVMMWATLLLVQEWRRPLERSRLAVGPGV